jgi:hypothetical protein
MRMPWMVHKWPTRRAAEQGGTSNCGGIKSSLTRLRQDSTQIDADLIFFAVFPAAELCGSHPAANLPIDQISPKFNECGVRDLTVGSNSAAVAS